MEKNEYKCNICTKFYKNYKSLWKHNYVYHKTHDNHNDNHDNHNDNHKDNHSIIIDKEKKYNCKKCGKEFEFYQNRWRHEKKCQTINNQSTKDADLIELKEEMVELKKQMNKTNIQNQNNNNGTINIDNSQKIINNFGSNNLECLTDKFKKKLMKEFIFEEDHVDIIPSLIKELNLNSDYKENNNFKISNLRSKIGYKYKDGKWKVDEKDKILNDVLKLGENILDDFMDELDHIPSNVQKGYDDFQGTKESIRKKMLIKIEMLCYLYFKNIEVDKELEI